MGARYGEVSAAGMRQPSLHGRTCGVPDNAGASDAADSYHQTKQLPVNVFQFWRFTLFFDFPVSDCLGVHKVNCGTHLIVPIVMVLAQSFAILRC